jgi:predicted permease
MFALRHASGQAGKLRLGRFFVGVQVAFAFCLVVAGAGFLFSLRNLFAVDTGFDPRGVAVLSVSNDMGPQQGALLSQRMQQLQSRIAALPNVQAAAIAWVAIFEGSHRTERVIVPGKTPSEREEIFYRISPGYFATLRIPLLDGRDLAFRDTDAVEPVPTIVNRAFARRYFGNEGALGKEFKRSDGVRHQIVGVAANSYYGDLRNGPEPVAYFPMKPPRHFALYVRSTLPLGSVARLVERETKAIGPGTRVWEITTLEALVGSTLLRERLLAGIGGVFAFLGLLLAAIGLFGLLNYSVIRRTKEIGIRAALGARRGELVLLVGKDLLALVSGGLLTGLAGSLAVMTMLHSLLFGIRAADPLVLGAAMAVFLIAAFMAGGLPAMRAAAVDPMIALRQD